MFVEVVLRRDQPLSHNHLFVKLDLHYKVANKEIDVGNIFSNLFRCCRTLNHIPSKVRCGMMFEDITSIFVQIGNVII